MLDDDAFLDLLRLRLRSARLARNLRQEDVAERAGIELRNYQRLESPTSKRRFNPTVSSLQALSRAIGVSLGELFTDATMEELEALRGISETLRVRVRRR